MGASYGGISRPALEERLSRVSAGERLRFIFVARGKSRKNEVALETPNTPPPNLVI